MNAHDLAVYVAIIAGTMTVMASTPPAFKTLSGWFHFLKRHLLADIYDAIDAIGDCIKRE